MQVPCALHSTARQRLCPRREGYVKLFASRKILRYRDSSRCWAGPGFHLAGIRPRRRVNDKGGFEGLTNTWVTIEVVAAGGATSGTVSVKKRSILSVADLRLRMVIAFLAVVAVIASVAAAVETVTAAVAHAAAAAVLPVAARAAAMVPRADQAAAAGCLHRWLVPAKAK